MTYRLRQTCIKSCAYYNGYSELTHEFRHYHLEVIWRNRNRTRSCSEFVRSTAFSLFHYGERSWQILFRWHASSGWRCVCHCSTSAGQLQVFQQTSSYYFIYKWASLHLAWHMWALCGFEIDMKYFTTNLSNSQWDLACSNCLTTWQKLVRPLDLFKKCLITCRQTFKP